MEPTYAGSAEAPRKPKNHQEQFFCPHSPAMFVIVLSTRQRQKEPRLSAVLFMVGPEFGRRMKFLSFLFSGLPYDPDYCGIGIGFRVAMSPE